MGNRGYHIIGEAYAAADGKHEYVGPKAMDSANAKAAGEGKGYVSSSRGIVIPAGMAGAHHCRASGDAIAWLNFILVVVLLMALYFLAPVVWKAVKIVWRLTLRSIQAWRLERSLR